MKILIILSTFFSYAGNIAALYIIDDSTSNLKIQAQKMADAFIKEDYKTFVAYNYKPMVNGAGGAAKMEQAITTMVNGMKAKGMSFLSISFDEPSTIVKSGTELQATIAQHTTIKLTQGKIVTTSTLIAISTDNGLNWTFVDTSNKDINLLRKAMPNLSPSITIPPPQAPVRYN
jgi:hypothetical protein